MKKLIFSAIAALLATSASANVVPVLIGNAPTAVGSLFRYDYSATLDADQSSTTGSYFTIYDFNGFSSFGNLPANFSGSTALLGQTPGNVLPTDSGSVLNVTFTYNGTAPINPGVNGGQGTSTELGTFSVFSTIGTLRSTNFTGLMTKNNGAQAGTTIANIGQVTAPGAVPEPATWGLMLVGFGMVGTAVRRRHTGVVTA